MEPEVFADLPESDRSVGVTRHSTASPILVDARETPPARRVLSQDEWVLIERRRRNVAICLFLATVVSTFVVGMIPGEGMMIGLDRYLAMILMPDRFDWERLLSNGAIYCVALMAILAAHEAGHWVQARRHGVPATLPFFIPFPISPFGTMGAVILQDGRSADRRKLFDIAISGPLAGLALAIPIVILGIKMAVVRPVAGGGMSYGDPLVLKWLVKLIHGPVPEGSDVILNPLLFAGWVGIFITALNLMPIGQLDGGHILYTLIGKRAHLVAMMLMAAGFAFMLYSKSPSYAVMMTLLLVMGTRHPPTADDRVPLGPVRTALGWLALAFVIVGFTPTPIVVPDEPPAKQERVQQPDKVAVWEGARSQE